MNTKALRGSKRKAGLLAGLVLACGLFAGNSQAQWIVNDPTSMAKAVEEYAEQAKRWADTVQQYKAVADHYATQAAFWQQQLVTLQSLNFQLFTMQNQFKKIPDDYGVQDACPGVSGGLSGDITSALQSFVPSMGGDVVKQQKQLCQLIVMTKNKQYNDTVDYLHAVATESERYYTIQTQRLRTAKSPADLQANSNELANFQSRISHAKIDWETNRQQNDTQIRMLEQIQTVLARRAMNGSPSAWGTLVNAVVLKGALSQ